MTTSIGRQRGGRRRSEGVGKDKETRGALLHPSLLLSYSLTRGAVGGGRLVVSSVGLALGVEDSLPVARLEVGLGVDVDLDADGVSAGLGLEDGKSGGFDEGEENAERKVGAPGSLDLAGLERERGSGQRILDLAGLDGSESHRSTENGRFVSESVDRSVGVDGDADVESGADRAHRRARLERVLGYRRHKLFSRLLGSSENHVDGRVAMHLGKKISGSPDDVYASKKESYLGGARRRRELGRCDQRADAGQQHEAENNCIFVAVRLFTHTVETQHTSRGTCHFILYIEDRKRHYFTSSAHPQSQRPSCPHSIIQRLPIPLVCRASVMMKSVVNDDIQ